MFSNNKTGEDLRITGGTEDDNSLVYRSGLVIYNPPSSLPPSLHSPGYWRYK